MDDSHVESPDDTKTEVFTTVDPEPDSGPTRTRGSHSVKGEGEEERENDQSVYVVV